ncbi:MAG: hypothetical protein ABW318_05885 [Vicinamibacterales bacterium]
MAKYAATRQGDVMATLAELIAKIAHALNISHERATRFVWSTLHPDLEQPPT